MWLSDKCFQFENKRECGSVTSAFILEEVVCCGD